MDVNQQILHRNNFQKKISSILTFVNGKEIKVDLGVMQDSINIVGTKKELDKIREFIDKEVN